MPKKTVSAGNFSNGMITDTIGATDSMVEIVDGWIPRVGEIRKRGGKQFIRNSATGMRRGERTSTTFAYVGGGRWQVRDASGAYATLSPTFQIDNSPFLAFTLVPIGGGDQIVAHGEQLISVGDRGSAGLAGITIVGKWGGALTYDSNTEATIDLTEGSVEVKKVGGGNFTNAYVVGQYVTFTRPGAPPNDVPHPRNSFRINSIRKDAGSYDTISLDRPWPGDSGTNYEMTGTGIVARLADPGDATTLIATGVPGARVLETHQDRLFLANFDPKYRLPNLTPDEPKDRQILRDRVWWSALWSENGDGTINRGNRVIYGEDLYYPNAYADIFPGVNGAITNMHSVGNALLIIKENGTYILRGSVSSKGFPSGATVDIVSNDVGCPSYRGSDKTEIGIAFANQRGLWVYNGTSLLNLVDEVVERQWVDPSFIDDYSDCVVSGINERIVVQVPGSDAAWVYHIDKKLFTKQTCHPHTNIVPIDGGEWAVDETTDNFVDWSYDFTEDNDEDSENSSYPRLKLQTQPMPADSEPFYTGRPNLLLVGGHFSASMQASIAYGRQEFDEFTFDADAQTGADDIFPLEYGVEVRDYDYVHRIPIGGVASRPAHRILLEQQDPALRMRIYGIGIEYLEDYTVDREDD